MGERKTNKLIFLDIDGVLNSEKFGKWCAFTEEGKSFWKEGGGCNLVDPDGVAKIVDICQITGAMVVISSSWRMSNPSSTLRYFKGFRDLERLNKYIVGVTVRGDAIRGKEIEFTINQCILGKPTFYEKRFELLDKDFFENQFDKDNFKYCIIDDDSDMLDEQKPYFVKTIFADGLTADKVKEVINILGKQEEHGY